MSPRMGRAGLAIALAMVWAGVAGAQERRTVAVNVVDEQGRQVTGLKAENFRGKFRGDAVKIVSAEWDTGPRRVVILLDSSDSMGWSGKFLVARKAAEDLVFHGGAENEVALIRFSNTMEETIPFQAGRQAVANRLAEMANGNTIKTDGRTALLDSFVEALRLLEPGRVGDIVYATTDGGDNASRSRDGVVREQLLCSGARVFFLLFIDPDRTFRGAEYRFSPAFADDLAKMTGGFAIEPFALQYSTVSRTELNEEEKKEVGSRVRWLYGLMAGYYRVEVELLREVDKTRGWDLEVVGEDGRKIKGVRVAYPRKLAPCEEEKP